MHYNAIYQVLFSLSNLTIDYLSQNFTHMALRVFFPFLLLLASVIYNSKAQDIAIGQWSDHLPYNKGKAVTEGGGKVYCATESAVFSYDKSDNAVQRLSKTTGLSDVEVSTVKYNDKNDVLLVAYTNTNIDLIENNVIINISDIKRKSIIGKKTINSIMMIENYAYLSCGFGIVVLDVTKKEIKDTYFVIPNGIEVFEMAFAYDTLFAATENGLYKASINSTNLADFVSWEKDTALPGGIYNTITSFNGKVYVNNSNIPTDTIHDDTIYVYNGNNWVLFDSVGVWTTNRLESLYNKLIITNKFSISIYDNTGARVEFIDNYYSWSSPRPFHAIISDDETVWIADGSLGLVKSAGQGNYEIIFPSGPPSKNVVAMYVQDNDLWVAAGGRTASWAPIWNRDAIFSYIDNQWITIYHNAFDIIGIIIDPGNKNKIYAAAWGKGVLEFDNGKLIETYDVTNTDNSLQTIIQGEEHIRIGGLAFDADNNLWVTNSRVDNVLSVKKTDGSWQAFQFPQFSTGDVGSIIVDSYNQKWIVLKQNITSTIGGILVFDDNNTIDDTSDDQAKWLNTGTGSGGLPVNTVICLAQDLDGEIWVGTTEGIAVFFSPEAVFSGFDFDAQQILVEQDGHFQYLLETEVVTAIAVDGANHKWIGTQKAGVFLMSEDGTEQILYFDENNSPLLSNNITSIAINHETGEVFFGIDKGIISYKSTATKGSDKFKKEDVYAYPNPVREDYQGIIAIKGLVTNAVVKITDISGTLIYETIAEGGQAIWSGKNFNGKKAHTGVYLVFASNEDGSETIVTKILVIN